MTEPAGRAMVIAPHPDDAEIGCGGTVAKWLAEGWEVVDVICTNGDKGSRDLAMTSERLAAIRENEQLKAAETLGVTKVVWLGHPDGGLEDTPDFRGELVRLIRLYRPDAVFTTDPYRRAPYLHRDHRITGTVTLDAVFPYSRDHLFYPEHLAEGLLPHRVREVYLWGSDNLDTFVNITETFDLKIAALRCHASQMGENPGSDFGQRWRERAAQLGQSQGLGLAEAFRRIQFRV
ncbi:MAG: hypothetical protein A2Y60_01610 [Chloroflexi bacterium RBG_13_54_9]|nr:MAG: hypothetical protein A2Y60_01610 [Chloroflexi bacterium RBG_13_54_9]